jgi:hypothetical protein
VRQRRPAAVGPRSSACRSARGVGCLSRRSFAYAAAVGRSQTDDEHDEDEDEGVAKQLKRERACGVLLFQKRPREAFLVLYRKDGSPDLLKGKVDGDESDVDAALR